MLVNLIITMIGFRNAESVSGLDIWCVQESVSYEGKAHHECGQYYPTGCNLRLHNKENQVLASPFLCFLLPHVM